MAAIKEPIISVVSLMTVITKNYQLSLDGSKNFPQNYQLFLMAARRYIKMYYFKISAYLIAIPEIYNT